MAVELGASIIGAEEFEEVGVPVDSIEGEGVIWIGELVGFATEIFGIAVI